MKKSFKKCFISLQCFYSKQDPKLKYDVDTDENGVLILHFKCPKDTQINGKQVQTCFKDQEKTEIDELPKCQLIKDNKIQSDETTTSKLKPFQEEILENKLFQKNSAYKITSSSYKYTWLINVLSYLKMYYVLLN